MRFVKLSKMSTIIASGVLSSLGLTASGMSMAENTGKPLAFRIEAGSIGMRAKDPYAAVRLVILNHTSQPVRILAVKNSFTVLTDNGQRFVSKGRFSMGDLPECASTNAKYCKKDDRADDAYITIGPNESLRSNMMLFRESRPSKAELETMALARSGSLSGSLYVKTPSGSVDTIPADQDEVAFKNTLQP